jgi:hypothetical protein
MLNIVFPTTTPLVYKYNPMQSKRVRYKAAYAFRGKGHVVARIKGSDMMDISLNLVEMHREQNALQFAETVEAWLRHIREEIQIARHESLANVTQIVEKQLQVRYGAVFTEELIALASQARVVMLLQHLQYKLVTCFGDQVKSVCMEPRLFCEVPTTKALYAMHKEYQATIFLAEMMTQAINTSYKKALDQFALPLLLADTCEKVDVGALALGLVDGKPYTHKDRCRQDLQKRIKGIIHSYFLQLEQTLCQHTARAAYHAYDELIESRIAWQTQRILRQQHNVSLLPAV